MARARSAVATPRVVVHPKRPEWGSGLIVFHQEGLVRVRFVDGVERSFRGDVLDAVVDADAVASALAALGASAPAAPAAKKPAAKKPAAKKPPRKPS